MTSPGFRHQFIRQKKCANRGERKMKRREKERWEKKLGVSTNF